MSSLMHERESKIKFKGLLNSAANRLNIIQLVKISIA